MKRKLIIILSFFILTFFIFAQTQENNRILKVGIEGDIDFFSPWDATHTLKYKILWNIYDTLITLEEKSTKIKPNLAVSWEARNNNRTWILKLREGVKFHDGSILSADDVVTSASVFQDFNAKVAKVNRLTVRFTLPKSNSGFLNNLADVRYAIAPSQIVQQYINLKNEERLKDFSPIGSGPFKFSYHEKGKQIVMDSFPDYWLESPWLKRLIYHIIPDNRARLFALRKGEIDLVDIILPAEIPPIKRNSNLNLLNRYGLNVSYLSMNTTHTPLNKIKIRQALNLAINKMRLAQLFYYGGYGVPTNRLLSPAFWGFSALPSPGRYQPALAKKILAEEGYSKGFSLKMVCIPLVRPYPPSPKIVAEEIKKELAAIGVKINIILPANFSEYDNILTSEDYDLVLTSWIDVTGDPDYTLSSLLSGNEYIYNNARWHNNLYDEKLQAARNIPPSDVSSKIRLYNEAQKIVQDEVPLIPLIHTKIFVVHNRKVTGLILYPSTMISFHKVKFER